MKGKAKSQTSDTAAPATSATFGEFRKKHNVNRSAVLIIQRSGPKSESFLDGLTQNPWVSRLVAQQKL